MKVKVNAFFEKLDSLGTINYSHEERVKNIAIQNNTQESVAKAIEKPSNPVLQLLNNMKSLTLGNSFNFEKVYNSILEKFNTAPKELKTSEEFSDCLEALMQGLPPDAPTQLRIGSLQSANHFHELKERLSTRTCTRLAMMKAELTTQVA